MRVMSLLKIVSLAAAVVLLTSLSGASMAAKMKMAPGSCAFEKHAIAAGAMCSYQCNPTTMWCSQQMCTNGQLRQIISCFGSFCTNKC
jgi:hypothetical protein